MEKTAVHLSEYHSEKENSLYPVCDSWLSHLSLWLEYNHNYSEGSIRAVQAFATLILQCIDIFFFFMTIKRWQ